MTPRPVMAARRAAIALALLALPGLAACAGTAPLAPFLRDLGSRITVIGPDPELPPDLDPDSLAPGWSAARFADGDGPGFSVTEHNGVRALTLENRGPGGLMGRSLRAPLLAMPYLHWGWAVEAAPQQADGRLLPDRPARAPVPVFLLIGFRTPSAEGRNGADPRAAAERLGDWTGAGAPRFDRALVLEWSAESVTPTGLYPRADPPRYVVHAGLEAPGRWITETVDLSWLYRRLWPDARVGEAEIAFIAAGAGPTRHPARAHVAGVTLSR